MTVPDQNLKEALALQPAFGSGPRLKLSVMLVNVIFGFRSDVSLSVWFGSLSIGYALIRLFLIRALLSSILLYLCIYIIA